MNKPIDHLLPKANFTVYEKWEVECPICLYDQDAPFNHGNPMSPMQITCKGCHQEFILTYERD